MKLLNFNEKPIIRVYQYNAFAESILSVHADYEAWIANNYIQIIYYKNLESIKNSNNGITLDYFSGSIFGSIPLLNYYGLDKNKLIISEERMNYLQEWIKNDMYIYTFIDEFYIPNMYTYKKNHFIHDILIYGYDSIYNTYKIIGYNKTGYSSIEIQASELYKAICNDISCLIKIELKKDKYEFNIKSFVEMCKDFYEARDSKNNIELYIDKTSFNNYFDSRLYSDVSFGIDIYDDLIILFNKYMYSKIKIDKRILYLIHEHEVNMLYKVNYLTSNHYIYKDDTLIFTLNTLVKKTSIMVYLGLKFNITFDNNIINRIVKILLEVKESDKNIFYNLLTRIKTDN